VTITGLLLMAAVGWFFFGEREMAIAQAGTGGVQVPLSLPVA
jgi:hypothetical protein